MNPDTNRFESLIPAEDQDALLKLKEQADSQLVSLLRPDGSPVPKHWAVFKVGEVITIKNYSFKVAYIGETAILFEPVGIPIVGEAEKDGK